MAFLDVHCFSESLKMSVAFHVVLPQKTAGRIGMPDSAERDKYPTLYLLHGLSDDHTAWMRRTSIERYAAAKSIAVVMPAVSRSFYQDMARGPQYWTFLSEELPALCQHWFPLSTAREDTFAAGLSMGGYGALRLALGRPDKFAAGASLSGALDIGKRLREGEKENSRVSLSEWHGVFGPELLGSGTGSDLFTLAERAAQSAAPQPQVYLCCGTGDALLPDTRDFHAHLDRLHLGHTYVESPGAHDWAYWDAQIQCVLDWLPLRK